MSVRRIVVLVLILCCAGRSQPVRAQDLAHETPAQRDARMAWWRDARFGMFIHWGAYAVAAGTYKGERIPGIGMRSPLYVPAATRSEEHTSELQSLRHLVCRLLLEKKKKYITNI